MLCIVYVKRGSNLMFTIHIRGQTCVLCTEPGVYTQGKEVTEVQCLLDKGGFPKRQICIIAMKYLPN